MQQLLSRLPQPALTTFRPRMSKNTSINIHLNVGRSDIAAHSPAQLRRKMPGMEVTVLSTLKSAGE